MKVSNKGWDQCGNAQAVANEDQIILAADVTDQANDKRQAVPMVDQTLENLEAAGVEQPIGAAVIDSGYYSEANTIGPGAARHRSPHRDRAVEAQRGNPAGTAWSDSQGPVGQATDGAEAANEERPRDVREAEGDDRADLWSVETGAGIPPVLDAGSGDDARRMAVDVHGAQSAEAVAACSNGDGRVIDAGVNAELGPWRAESSHHGHWRCPTMATPETHQEPTRTKKNRTKYFKSR